MAVTRPNAPDNLHSGFGNSLSEFAINMGYAWAPGDFPGALLEECWTDVPGPLLHHWLHRVNDLSDKTAVAAEMTALTTALGS